MAQALSKSGRDAVDRALNQLPHPSLFFSAYISFRCPQDMRALKRLSVTRVSKTENIKGLEGKKMNSMNTGGGIFFG